MNADEVVRALKECGDCDNCPYYSCWIDEETGDPADACNDGRLFKDILSLIESLQAQLAKEKRRAEKAVEDIKVMALAMRESEELSVGCCFACIYENLSEDCILPYGECPGYERDDCFEWRGLEEEEGGEK